jgi:hypothetical protein
MHFADKDFTEIRTWAKKIITLLNEHRISSIDNSRHLIVTMDSAQMNGGVRVVYAESPLQNSSPPIHPTAG